MSVGLLIITHNNIGLALIDTAKTMLGKCPLSCANLPVLTDSDPDALVAQGQRYIDEVNSGGGVIILTDMYGSTPGNIANALRRANADVEVISGVNLPMLVRLFNYPQLAINQMIDKALTGGIEGIFVCGEN